MHDIFVGQPGEGFREKKGCYRDENVKQNGHCIGFFNDLKPCFGGKV
jgi:hypothetical protein